MEKRYDDFSPEAGAGLNGPPEILDSHICPHCRSQDISGGPVTIEGRKAVQDCDCNNCGKYFEAEYVLSAIRTEATG